MGAVAGPRLVTPRKQHRPPCDCTRCGHCCEVPIHARCDGIVRSERRCSLTGHLLLPLSWSVRFGSASVRAGSGHLSISVATATYGQWWARNPASYAQWMHIKRPVAPQAPVIRLVLSTCTAKSSVSACTWRLGLQIVCLYCGYEAGPSLDRMDRICLHSVSLGVLLFFASLGVLLLLLVIFPEEGRQLLELHTCSGPTQQGEPS